jgi:sugar-phosphatase
VTTYLLSDLDGVLVDSTASVERAWRDWAASRGVDFELVVPGMHGVPSKQTIAAVAPQLDADAESAALDTRQAHDPEGIVALPGAAELLAGDYGGPVAVVTSGRRDLATNRLRMSGLEPPDVFVTSDQVTHGKPDPEGYLLAAKRLGADPADCVVIEDAPAGIAAGKAAGMRVIAVLTTHEAVDLHEADEVIPNLAALGEVLPRLRVAAQPRLD